jgi:ankyrin repeat protein
VKNLLNHVDEYGFAMIHYFAKINYYEVIQLLKEHGADMNILTRDEKHSPLVIAAILGHEMTVQALVRNSANF